MLPGAEEQQRLRRGVKRHMQHQGQRGDFAADAEGGDHDAGLVDRGVGQQAAEVLLHQQERHGDPMERMPSNSSRRPGYSGPRQRLVST